MEKKWAILKPENGYIFSKTYLAKGDKIKLVY